ncbi:ladinin-1 isoform X2 [Clupea harengus]|uniref:Ladinin-1 isoform X2 n=1 Tax=Clupea harengus TaxID=7950 RepID=A0A8M1KPH5_CLUHA|nr:ladinin-1 isoform X2 [Clupea harengus]
MHTHTERAEFASLARQWTVEDEEEQKREHRRKTRDPSISADPDDDDGLSSDGNQDSRSVSSAPQDPSEQGEGNMQPAMDFVEMLRSRDERRRARHLETLRRQKQEEEDGGEEGGEAQPRVELLGDVEVEEAFLSPLRSLLARESTTSTASPASPTSPTSPASPASISTSHSRSHSSNSAVEGQNEDGKADSNQSSPRKTSRKFVSSFSISIDTSPASASPQRVVSPLSPRGPPERPFSPTFGGPQSPTLNGGTENGASSSFEPATRPAFIKQSSRTTSFRLKKQEEEQSMPLQRSASVRVTSKIESNKTREEDQDEQQQSPFQRNSKQRISARAIQEKMERLAQAAQKQTNKSPFQAERTLFLMDEVVRKKNIFESEQPKGEKEPGMSRQEYRNFSSGIADRINRWVQKQTKSSPSSTSTDLRNVDIVSKKILFEQAKDDRPMSPVPHSKSPK